MSRIADLHQPLLQQPGSRELLNTPALVIDADALNRNLSAMARFVASKGVQLRPHAKTHKSVDIARRQIDAGAAGVCCAKLGEAEALAAGGIDSILITSPVVSAPAMRRLAALAGRMRDLRVVVDNPTNVRALADVSQTQLQILIDIDPGIRRTGVSTPEAAVELLHEIRRYPRLTYLGVQMYCGVHQHVASYAERSTSIAERMDYLRSIIELLRQAGGEPQIVTGGGTGTHRIDAELGVYNEWQVGSYIFMDRQYAECELAPAGPMPFEHALFVDARVVSANTRGMATIDAGYKALATDAGSPLVVSGAPTGSVYHFMGDEHGAIVDPQFEHRWEIGQMVRLAVPHCDPTVNLYDVYHVLKGDVLTDLWPVTARGLSF